MNFFKPNYLIERLTLIHRQMPILTMGSLVVIAIIYVSIEASTHPYLRVWAILMSMVTLVRAAVWYYYHLHPYNSANVNTRLYALYVFFLLPGALWGAAGITLFSMSSSFESVLLVLVFAALVSSTLVSIASVLAVYIIYATLVISPLGLYLILQDDLTLITLGASVYIFLLANILMSFNVERAMIDSIILKDDNEKLIAQLIEQKEIAEQSDLEKSKFVAAISHDLRQPMHAMGLFLNGLQPYVRKPGKKVFDKVQDSARALRSLFNGLLDLSRLEAGVAAPNLEIFHLAPVLRNIVDGFSGQAKEKGLILEAQILETGVHSDPMLLERVIRNLLANAVQYTDSGQVYLSSALDEEFVTITIRDEGRGIPEEEIENIFSSYHQLHNSERDRSKGVGLGLAIVRRICALLSIPIQVNSQLGKGSSFSLKVPAADLSASKHKKTKQVSWDLQGQFIVVIDDEQDIRTGTERLLKSWGCNTIVAESGQEALEQLAAQTLIPSVLIADYRLRAENGIQVITNIRNEHKLNISAMIITGDTTVDFSNEAKQNDLVILHKPISPAELRTAIFQLISQSD